MEIVSITVCVNYSDYFEKVIDRNSSLVNHMYVVTTKTDVDTAALCDKRENVTVLFYDDLNKNGSQFNKSGMVRFAQTHVYQKHPDAWVLIIDADILLPEDFRKTFESTNKDENALYGMQRVDFNTQSDLEKNINARPYRLCFVGYFQLYKNKTFFYENYSKNCSICDDRFAKIFKTKVKLPGNVFHLGTPMINWSGRKSNRWN